MLDSIDRGRVTVSVDGKPVLSLDSDAKFVEFEMAGLEKINLKISNLFVAKAGRGRKILESSHIVRKFTKNGWRFSLYDKGEHLLTACGLSRFGPHLRFNPLKLRRILKVI